MMAKKNGDPPPSPPKTFIMFSTDQAAALVKLLIRAREELSGKKQQDYDQGPLGQILKNLRG